MQAHDAVMYRELNDIGVVDRTARRHLPTITCPLKVDFFSAEHRNLRGDQIDNYILFNTLPCEDVEAELGHFWPWMTNGANPVIIGEFIIYLRTDREFFTQALIVPRSRPQIVSSY